MASTSKFLISWTDGRLKLGQKACKEKSYHINRLRISLQDVMLSSYGDKYIRELKQYIATVVNVHMTVVNNRTSTHHSSSNSISRSRDHHTVTPAY